MRIRSLAALTARRCGRLRRRPLRRRRHAAAQTGAFTALDYQEITQLINRYAYGIDTCANNGYDYANVFTADGMFIDRNSDAGFAAGGRVLAQGREALATLVGGGSRGCATKLVWTDWSHLMLNHEITPTATVPRGACISCSSACKGPGSVARHGGYEDVYVRTPRVGASNRARTCATRLGTARSCARRI